MKAIIPILTILLLVGCTESNNQQLNKTFEGELVLSPAENALLGFDRMIEIENDSLKRANLKNKIKAAGFVDSRNSLALFVTPEKTENAKAFIDEFSDQLILERHHEFIWKKEKTENLLYLKDNKKSIDISELVLSVNKSDTTLTIQFAPNAKRVLSGFAMKYLNRPILVEIDNEVVTSVKSFGKMEDGILRIKTN